MKLLFHNKSAPLDKRGNGLDDEILLNKLDFPSIEINDIIEIQFLDQLKHVWPIKAFRDGVPPRDAISIEKSTAAALNVKQVKDVIVKKIDIKTITLNLVEMQIKDQYFSHSDFYRFQQSLIGKLVFTGRKLDYLNSAVVRCQGQISELWCNGEVVNYGYVDENTKVCFRSPTAVAHIFVQISQEMWEFDSFGEIYFEKTVFGFLADLFSKWAASSCSHDVTIVLFSRVYYEAKSMEEFPDQDCIQQDKRGRFYQDFYRVVIQNERYVDEWPRVLKQLKTTFHTYRQHILNYHNKKHCNSPKGYISMACNGNFLEMLNMPLNFYQCYNLDRNFDRTGKMCVVVTPGAGVFEVERHLMALTKRRILDLGVPIDLVCMGEQPLHAVPLFKVFNTDNRSFIVSTSSLNDSLLVSGNTITNNTMVTLNTANVTTEGEEFNIPHWINHSFYRSVAEIEARRQNIFVPRIKLRVSQKHQYVMESLRSTEERMDSINNNSKIITNSWFGVFPSCNNNNENNDIDIDHMPNGQSNWVPTIYTDFDFDVHDSEVFHDYPTALSISGRSFGNQTAGDSTARALGLHPKRLVTREHNHFSDGNNSSSTRPMFHVAPNNRLTGVSTTSVEVPADINTSSQNITLSRHGSGGSKGLVSAPLIPSTAVQTTDAHHAYVNSISTGISNVSSHSQQKAALHNPFTRGFINPRMTSNRRRWAHVFPVDVHGKPIQPHHALEGNLNDALFSKSKKHIRSLTALCAKCDNLRLSNGGSAQEDMLTRPFSSINEGTFTTNSISDAWQQNIEFTNSAISNSEESLVVQELHATGVDWKSLITPAALPVTTDYFPNAHYFEDFCQHSYTLLPSDCSQEDWNKLPEPMRIYKRRPLLITEIFTELINQRLNQGFQICVEPAPPNSIPQSSSNTMKHNRSSNCLEPQGTNSASVTTSDTASVISRQSSVHQASRLVSNLTSASGTKFGGVGQGRSSFPSSGISSPDAITNRRASGGGTVHVATGFRGNLAGDTLSSGGKSLLRLPEESLDQREIKMSIGRLFHTITLVGEEINVKIQRPNVRDKDKSASALLKKFDYRYRIFVPDGIDYAVSWVEFNNEFLNEINWNRLDNYICTHGEADDYSSLKFWRSRFLLLPAHDLATKKIMESLSRKDSIRCDIYESKSHGEQMMLTDGFLRLVEAINKIRRASVAAKKVGYFDFIDSNQKSSLKSLPVADSPAIANNSLKQPSTPKVIPNLSSSDLLSGTSKDFTDKTPYPALVQAMSDSSDGLQFINLPGMPPNTFISAEAVHWIVNRVRDAETGLTMHILKAIAMLKMMVEQNLLCHASEVKTHKFIYGFYLYYIVPNPNPSVSNNASHLTASGSTHSFDVQWCEVAFPITISDLDNNVKSTYSNSAVINNFDERINSIDDSVKPLDDTAIALQVMSSGESSNVDNIMMNESSHNVDINDDDKDSYLPDFLRRELPFVNLLNFVDYAKSEHWFGNGQSSFHSNQLHHCHRELYVDLDLSLPTTSCASGSASNTTLTNVELCTNRAEWCSLKYAANYHPLCAFEMELQWIVATGSRLGELVLNWSRRSSNAGFQLIPVPCNQFALPHSSHSDPVRGPIFIPLYTECLLEGREQLFSGFVEHKPEKRMQLFQEQILRRFGFIPDCVCQPQVGGAGKQSDPNDNSTFRTATFVHSTGGMFAMIPDQRRGDLDLFASTDTSGIINYSRAARSSRPKSCGSSYLCDSIASSSKPHLDSYQEYIEEVTGTNANLLSKEYKSESKMPQHNVGFIWAWNFMLTKKWRTNMTGDENFQDYMLTDFRLFCRNADNRLLNFWKSCHQLKTVKEASM